MSSTRVHPGPSEPAGALRDTVSVIGSPIDVITPEGAVNRILNWGRERESRYVCICNVHSVVTAVGEPEFAQVLAGADMATPDGAPVAWWMRRMGVAHQKRVSGPDLMWDVCRAATAGDRMFLLGSTPATLARLQSALRANFPQLCISGSYSPPFRPLAKEEEAEIAEKINACNSNVVWVSLGCPKQEKWMARQRGHVHAVMVGVGAAFDFHAGDTARAPRWMRDMGLEWLHRLMAEPRRLWRRYLVTNSLFVFYVLREWVFRSRGRARSAKNEVR